MKVIDEAVLDLFRGPGVCDLCEKPVSNREPHHVLCRGMGGGSRVDHRWNILSACATFAGGNDCHYRIHLGCLTIKGRRQTREELFEIVARREGVLKPDGITGDGERVEAFVRLLIRLPKGSPIPEAA